MELEPVVLQLVVPELVVLPKLELELTPELVLPQLAVLEPELEPELAWPELERELELEPKLELPRLHHLPRGLVNGVGLRTPLPANYVGHAAAFPQSAESLR